MTNVCRYHACQRLIAENDLVWGIIECGTGKPLRVNEGPFCSIEHAEAAQRIMDGIGPKRMESAIVGYRFTSDDESPRTIDQSKVRRRSPE